MLPPPLFSCIYTLNLKHWHIIIKHFNSKLLCAMFSAHHALSHNFAHRVLHFAQHRASFFHDATRIYHNFDRFFLPLSSLMWISKRIFICYLQYTYTYLFTHIEKKLWSFGYNANKQQQNRKLFFIYFIFAQSMVPLNFLSTFSKRELLYAFFTTSVSFIIVWDQFLSLPTRALLPAHINRKVGENVFMLPRARGIKKNFSVN